MGGIKRLTAAVITSAVVVSAVGVAAAGALVVHQPEINPAAATIQVKAVNVFAPAHCIGVGGQAYVTYRGALAGTETATAPATSGYPLSGALTIKKVVWTVNSTTGRGVFRGQATLVGPTSAAASAVTYSGLITLVTQQPVPLSTTPGGGSARGWINAATYTGGKADGGSLLANVEFTFGPGLTASGQFGGSATAPDLSAVTDNVAC